MEVAGSSLLYSRLSFEEACTRLRELRFDYVDIGMLEGWAHIDPSTAVDDPERIAEEIMSVCDKHELEPLAVNARLGAVSASTDRSRIRALATVAESLNIKSITIPAGVAPTVEKDLERFERLVDATAGYDVTLAVETHYDTPTGDPAGAKRYVRQIPKLKLTLDPSHFAIESYSIGDYHGLFGDVAHIHVRQAGTSWAEVQRPIDRGQIDFGRLFEELSVIGYDGTVSIEYIDSLDGVDPADAEREALEAFEHVSAFTG